MGDNNALIVFSDASSIAVTLNSQTPPWSCFVANQSALGAGTVTLTPFSGTISYAGNPAAASMPVLPTYCALVCFDGTSWWGWTEPIVPVGFSAISHQFLTAYNALTGAFTSAAQPASSLSTFLGSLKWRRGVQAQATPGLVAGTNVTITGSWPDQTINASTTGLSVTITTAQLTPTGTQGSMTFSNGLLVSQVQAT